MQTVLSRSKLIWLFLLKSEGQQHFCFSLVIYALFQLCRTQNPFCVCLLLLCSFSFPWTKTAFLGLFGPVDWFELNLTKENTFSVSLLNYALFSFFAVDRSFGLFVGNHEKNLVFLQVITMIHQFLFKESKNCITTADKEKKRVLGAIELKRA